MAAALPQDVAKELEQHIIRQVKHRLLNWGAWWWQGNKLEVKRLTGVRNCSNLYGLMQRGKVSQRSGYADPHRMPVDEEDAIAMNGIITSGILKPAHIDELRRFYCDQGGTGTPQQSTLRWRVIRELAGLHRGADT